MTAHYMYALPVAIAFLALKAKGKSREMGFQRIDARHHPLSVDQQRIPADRLYVRIKPHKKPLSSG